MISHIHTRSLHSQNYKCNTSSSLSRTLNTRKDKLLSTPRVSPAHNPRLIKPTSSTIKQVKAPTILQTFQHLTRSANKPQNITSNATVISLHIFYSVSRQSTSTSLTSRKLSNGLRRMFSTQPEASPPPNEDGSRNSKGSKSEDSETTEEDFPKPRQSVASRLAALKKLGRKMTPDEVESINRAMEDENIRKRFKLPEGWFARYSYSFLFYVFIAFGIVVVVWNVWNEFIGGNAVTVLHHRLFFFLTLSKHTMRTTELFMRRDQDIRKFLGTHWNLEGDGWLGHYHKYTFTDYTENGEQRRLVRFHLTGPKARGRVYTDTVKRGTWLVPQYQLMDIVVDIPEQGRRIHVLRDGRRVPSDPPPKHEQGLAVPLPQRRD